MNIPQFDTIEEAFGWFLENVYPELSSDEKKKLKDAKYNFLAKGRSMSQKKMLSILNEYGELKNHFTYRLNI